MNATQRFDTQNLYDLLPDIYRIRDAEQGEPLKAVLSAIAEQIAVLDENLEQLYDDQFIETCADWVVPYLGDLIGYRALHGVASPISSPRAEVAHTIGYRRRKGTASVLAQLAQDVTGWQAAIVEFFQYLGTTQYMNHLRHEHRQTPDLRDWRSLERINTPFDRLSHTLDVRRIATQQGRYNIPNIGIFLWRLQGYRLVKGTARAITPDGRYTFNPLGLDAPLFNQPQPAPELALTEPQGTDPKNFTAPLSRRELYAELAGRRQAIATAQPVHPTYFQNGSAAVFQVFLDEAAVQPEDLQICNLSDWRRPQAPIRVAVDPVLGRLTLPVGVLPRQVSVTYTYGFSRDLGGGPYDRSDSVLPLLHRPVTWQAGVSQTLPPVVDQIFATVGEAITAWNHQPAGSMGVIAIMDSHTYPEAFPAIRLKAGSQLLLVAADWLEVENPEIPGQRQRLPGQIVPVGLRPHLQGDLSVQPDPIDPQQLPGQLILSGLLVEGHLTVSDGNLGSLQIADCTLRQELTVADSNPQLSLHLTNSICAAITLSEQVPHLEIVNSLVDGAIAAPGAETTLQTSTILGSTTVRSLEASNSIFVGKAIALRRQIGCVRFCCLPLDSQVAQRYRCQPELALTQRATALKLNSFTQLLPAERNAIQARLTPLFTSVRYGDPGYGQLSPRCAVEIRQGADDEAEMGALHDLYQPQRETNLRVRLDEYLRFGLEAGIFYVT